MPLEKNDCKHLKVPKLSNEDYDRLKLMLSTQKEINKMFMPSVESLEDKKKWTMLMKVALDGEMAELMETMKFKWWSKDNEVDIIELKYEIIDILHFLLSIMLIWGMDSDQVYSMYLAKAQENINRQKRGY